MKLTIFFWLLGLKNAYRNLGRSLISIIAMAFATAFITYSLSLGRGFPVSLHAAYRSIIGGEISIYASLFNNNHLVDNEGIGHNRLESSNYSDLDIWYPEYFTNGYLNQKYHEIMPFNEILENLEEDTDIKAIYPRYQMPVIRGQAGFDLRNPVGHVLNTTNLRGRDIRIDALQYQHPSATISEGRWFDEFDVGQMVCIVPSHPRNGPEGAPVPSIGEMITIHIPRIFPAENGGRIDFFNYVTLDLEVIGIIEMPSRFINWQNGKRQMHI